MSAPLLTAKQAAEALGITVKQLRNLTANGHVTFVNVGRGEKRPAYRYASEDIERLYKSVHVQVPALREIAAPEDGRCYVYFVEAGGSIKIGQSKNVRDRMRALQSGCPFQVRLVHYEEGGETLEREYHDLFRAHHERLEWFRLEGSLRDYLEALQ